MRRRIYVGGALVSALAVLGDPGYRRHLDQLRRRLATARVEAARRLSSVGITPWIMPRGGFYLWCRLPDGCDITAPASPSAIPRRVARGDRSGRLRVGTGRASCMVRAFRGRHPVVSTPHATREIA